MNFDDRRSSFPDGERLGNTAETGNFTGPGAPHTEFTPEKTTIELRRMRPRRVTFNMQPSRSSTKLAIIRGKPSSRDRKERGQEER
jgi:hypothetical protein